jgi:hypothetical protein
MVSHLAVAYTVAEQRRQALSADAQNGASRLDALAQPAPVLSSPNARLWARLLSIVQRIARHHFSPDDGGAPEAPNLAGIPSASRD